MSSPLDSTYASGVARLIFQNQQARQRVKSEGDQDDTDFGTLVKRMARQKAIDLQNQNHQANREGLFYSGQLGKRRGMVEHDYSDRESDQRTQHDRRVTARAAALNQLGSIIADPNSQLGYRGTGSAAFDLGDLYDGAVARQTERDQAAQFAVQQQPDATPAAAAGGAGLQETPARVAPGARRIAPSAAHGGARWEYIQNSNGTWRPVRPVNGFGH